MKRLKRQQLIERQLQDAYRDISDYYTIDAPVWDIITVIIPENKKINKYNVYKYLSNFPMQSKLKRRMFAKIKAFINDVNLFEYLHHYRYAK